MTSYAPCYRVENTDPQKIYTLSLSLQPIHAHRSATGTVVPGTKLVRHINQLPYLPSPLLPRPYSRLDQQQQ